MNQCCARSKYKNNELNKLKNRTENSTLTKTLLEMEESEIGENKIE